MKNLAFVALLAAFLTACPTGQSKNAPNEFIANFVGYAPTEAAFFSSAQGGTSGLVLEACSSTPDSPDVTVSLEGAPTGVSLSQPSNGKIPLFNCTLPRPQYIQPNFILSIADNAPTGLEKPFLVVLQKGNQSVRLKASITVFTIPAAQQNFMAYFNLTNFSLARGGTSGRVLNVCGENGFFGKVEASLEGAPAGVRLEPPSSFTAYDCSTALGGLARPQVALPVAPNFFLSASSNAVLGNDLSFKVVLKSATLTRKLDIIVSIAE